MLPMLTVSGTPGLVYLNGRLCGETGAAAMPLARDGVQYLELRPFDAGARGAVLRLRVADGRLVEGVSGEVFAVQWPNGWIALELRGGPGAEADVPQADPTLLARLDMPGGQYLLVNEDGVPTFGRDADEAVFLPTEGVTAATLRPLQYPGLCAAEGDCAAGRFAAVLRAQAEPEIVQCAVGASAQVDGQGVLHCVEPTDDLVGHATIFVWSPDAQGRYALRSRETAWLGGSPRWPQTPGETARAWLEALRYGAHDEAAGYLLRPELSADLAQTAGAFDSVVDLPADGTDGVNLGVARMEGENLLVVRRLDFTTVRQPGAQGNWKIETISEGVCD